MTAKSRYDYLSSERTQFLDEAEKAAELTLPYLIRRDEYQKGIIDRQEVLKKTEVFDMEGVMERTDIIAKLQQELEQTQEEIKQLKGDLQTRDREAVNLRKKVEVEKFKGDLDQVSTKAKAAGDIYEKRLDDTLATVKTQIRDAAKQSSTPSGGEGTAKRRKK